MREIPLTQGRVALVDDEDYEALVAMGSWCVQIAPYTAYAVRRDPSPDARAGKLLRMHSVLTGWPLVDHRDGNGLNNQRQNLRPATKSQNLQNSRIHGRNTSGYRGVSHDSDRAVAWHAYISIAGKRVSLGRYPTAIEAAHVYDAAAREHFGEYARPNFPIERTA